MRVNSKVYIIPTQLAGNTERVQKNLADLILDTASRMLDESPSNLERVIAARILGQKHCNFRGVDG